VLQKTLLHSNSTKREYAYRDIIPFSKRVWHGSLYP